MYAVELRAHKRAQFSPLLPVTLTILFVAPFLFVPIPAARAAGGLALDRSAVGSFSSTGTGTVTLSTTSANDVIVVLVANENTGHAILNTVSSITASALTFAKRSSGSMNSQPFSDLEVWYAIAASQLLAVVLR